MTDTVLTVAALGDNDMSKWMGGWAGRNGRAVIKVRSAADLDKNTIPDAAKELDLVIRLALEHSTGEVIVLAHSQGCQVVGEWLAKYGGIGKGRLRFVLTGNLERQYFGYIANKPWYIRGGNSVRQTPNNTDYPVTDIGRRDDLWANFPGGLKAMLGLPFCPAHLNYNSVDPDHLDPRYIVKVVGKTTYYTVP
jgi:hypothetical protein